MATASTTPKLSQMKYRVVNNLGAGAGSTILLISDKNSGGKRFALKIARKQEPEDQIYIDQARNEYDASQKLNHPAIVKIYDYRVKKSWFRVVGAELLMEYIDGKALDDIEAPELNQLVLIFSQVASALAHMHRRGVYHGDLKPQNIMLSKNGQVKLIDFGTAWIRGQDKNRVQGTPQFIAPEQAAERVVNERTDVYNFGATMYRMLTGRFAQSDIPKPGANRKLPAVNQINPRVLSRLNNLILACLELNPEKRPTGMFEVREALSAVIKEMGLEEVELRGADEEE